MTEIEMNAEIARLQAENAALKASKTNTLSCKISEKGGVSVYGLGKFPVTLYGTQWERLIAFTPRITEYLKANKDKLTVKS
jgi:hypothetical protein